ncbi:MAG TPA: FAD-dependent oxidoreductase, partial [Acidimicrobiia bacterium]|nr:FAD-dependent oxidoreductase [Acidimicrobiia bacterium]
MAGGRRVAVMGAGVGGLTAAHELAERGFSVVVYENRTAPGGKARSMPVPDTGGAGRPPLPAEHGFRFFPGFYRHVPDTMRRIPYGAATVFDNLVPASHVAIAREGKSEIVLPAHLPTSPGDVGLVLKALLTSHTGLSVGDAVHFAERLAALLASCRQRRLAELEDQSWWEFSGAAGRSAAYQKFLADGLTRTLVAAKATEMSARTGGSILLQLLFDMVRIGRKIDRVLCGPTSDVWVTPWVNHLRGLGVEFHFDARVTDIHCDGRQITGLSVRSPATSKLPTEKELVTADHYVAAVPVEIMCEALLNDDMRKADPGLANLV